MAISRSSFSNPTYTRVPSPESHTPWGSVPTGIVVTLEKSSVRKTWTWFKPPTGTFAHVTVGGLNQVQVFRTDDFSKVTTIPVGRLPHVGGVAGAGTRGDSGFEGGVPRVPI